MVGLLDMPIRKMLEAHKIPADSYDYKAMWDSKLKASENFDNIRKDCESKGLWKMTEKEQVVEVKQQSKQLETEQKAAETEKLEAERLAMKLAQEKLLNEAKNTKYVAVDLPTFKPAKELIQALVTGKGHGGYGLILEGEGGLGKSYLVESELKKANVNYEKLSGHTTALGLFAFLQRNNEKDILLIDDISINDLRDNTIKAMLKAIFWKPNESAKRLLRWNAFKTEAELRKDGLNPVFELKPKVILICNEFPSDMDSEAVKSRCLYRQFSFTRDEKLQIMYAIARNVDYKGLTEAERVDIVDYIRSKTAVYTIGLDLRSLIKAFYLKCSQANWKELVDEMFGIDDEMKAIDENMGESEWCSRFGKSRRTFFRTKEKWKQCQSVKGGVGYELPKQMSNLQI